MDEGQFLGLFQQVKVGDLLSARELVSCIYNNQLVGGQWNEVDSVRHLKSKNSAQIIVTVALLLRELFEHKKFGLIQEIMDLEAYLIREISPKELRIIIKINEKSSESQKYYFYEELIRGVLQGEQLSYDKLKSLIEIQNPYAHGILNVLLSSKENRVLKRANPLRDIFVRKEENRFLNTLKKISQQEEVAYLGAVFDGEDCIAECIELTREASTRQIFIREILNAIRENAHSHTRRILFAVLAHLSRENDLQARDGLVEFVKEGDIQAIACSVELKVPIKPEIVDKVIEAFNHANTKLYPVLEALVLAGYDEAIMAIRKWASDGADIQKCDQFKNFSLFWNTMEKLVWLENPIAEDFFLQKVKDGNKRALCVLRRLFKAGNEKMGSAFLAWAIAGNPIALEAVAWVIHHKKRENPCYQKARAIGERKIFKEAEHRLALNEEKQGNARESCDEIEAHENKMAKNEKDLFIEKATAFRKRMMQGMRNDAFIDEKLETILNESMSSLCRQS